MILLDLSQEQKIIIFIFSLIELIICGILHLIKIKFKDKIVKCNNKLLKRIFEEL